SSPEKLLDTIRSRTLPVRFGPLPDHVVAAILRQHGVEDARLDEIVEMAGGSASVALASADESGERVAFGKAVLRAVNAPPLGAAMQLSASLSGKRAHLIDVLRALAGAYARHGRRVAGSDPASAEIAARR